MEDQSVGTECGWILEQGEGQDQDRELVDVFHSLKAGKFVVLKRKRNGQARSQNSKFRNRFLRCDHLF